MKLIFKKSLIFLLGAVFFLNVSANQYKEIKIASHIEPMTDIIELIKDDVKKDGYELKLILVKDNIQPNIALQNKEIDANFFQHIPYMQQFNKSHNSNLVGIVPIYDAVVGFYSKKHKSIKEIPNGATIGIPNDPPNQARALAILDSYNLIELKKDKKDDSMIRDIALNPHNYKFLAIDLLNLSRAYDEVDMVFNYPAYARKIGLKPKDIILMEKSNGGKYAISLVAREDNKNSEKIQLLKKVLTSDKVKHFLQENDGIRMDF